MAVARCSQLRAVILTQAPGHLTTATIMARSGRGESPCVRVSTTKSTPGGRSVEAVTLTSDEAYRLVGVIQRTFKAMADERKANHAG